MKRDCWIVLNYQELTSVGKAYCFQGVFDSVELAESECLTNQYYIIPATMNEKIPHTLVESPDGYFPVKG